MTLFNEEKVKQMAGGHEACDTWAWEECYYSVCGNSECS